MSELTSQINQLLAQLPEGDRARVLRFAEDIHTQRQGKRAARRNRRNTSASLSNPAAPAVTAADLLRG